MGYYLKVKDIVVILYYIIRIKIEGINHCQYPLGCS